MKTELQQFEEAKAEIDKDPKNPEVLAMFEKFATQAAGCIATLINSQNENIALAAAREILDRSGYIPAKPASITQNNVTVNNNSAPVVMTEEEFKTLVDSYARRTAVTVDKKDLPN